MFSCIAVGDGAAIYACVRSIYLTEVVYVRYRLWSSSLCRQWYLGNASMLDTHTPISMFFLVPSDVIELAASTCPQDNRTVCRRSGNINRWSKLRCYPLRHWKTDALLPPWSVNCTDQLCCPPLRAQWSPRGKTNPPRAVRMRIPISPLSK